MPRVFLPLRSLLSALFLWGGLSHAVLAAPAPRYMPTLIDAPGSWSGQGTALNDVGQVVGFIGPTAFLWTPTIGLQNLGTLPGHGHSHASSINDSGQVTGSSRGDYGRTRAFLYSDGTMTDVSPSGASANGQAINGHGHIVGTDEGDGFIRDGQNVRTLSGAGHIPRFAPVSINDRGDVVGYGMDPQSGATHVLLHRDGETSILLPDAAVSFAAAVNNAGQIAGTYVLGTPESTQTGFLYTDGVVTDIVGLGADIFDVYGLNDAGEVVGVAWSQAGGSVPFLFSGGEMFDLRARLAPTFPQDWTISYVADINNRGQILVTVSRPVVGGYELTPVLLSPVPEPQTLALVLGGLALLCWRRRQRRR